MTVLHLHIHVDRLDEHGARAIRLILDGIDTALEAEQLHIDEEPSGHDQAHDEPLECPTCHRADFTDRRGLAAHQRSHQTATCQKCGRTINAAGLGPHRAHCTGPTSTFERRPFDPDRARAAAARAAWNDDE